MPAIDPPIARHPPRRHFDEAAMRRLQALLSEEASPLDGGLPVEGIDGLFSAALVAPGPTLALPEVLPLALGAPDAAVSEELTGLLGLMWDATRQRIARQPEGEITHLLPLILFPPADGAGEAGVPDDFPIGAVWALGFMLGYGLRRVEWEQRLETDEDLAFEITDILALAAPLLEPIDAADEDSDLEALPIPDFGCADDATGVCPQCGEEDAGEWPDPAQDDADLWFDPDEDDADDLWLDADGDDDIEPIDLEERLDIISDLPAILHRWHLAALQERTPGTPARHASGPGRNDPCPCGSGRKFKKCHGDAARLH